MKTNKLLLTAGALFAALALSLTGCKKDEANSVSLNNRGEFEVVVSGTTQAVLSSGGSAVDASQVTWTATVGTEYFTIDATGLITGKAVGQGQFTAAYNGNTATGYVTVVSNVVTEVPGASVLPAYTNTTESQTFTLAVYVPENSGCNKIITKATNTQNAQLQWNEEVELTAVEGWPRWYAGVVTLTGIGNSKLADGTLTYNLKICQTDESGSVGESWERQWSKTNADIHLLTQTTAVTGKKPVIEDEGGDGTGTSTSGEPNLKVFEPGIVYVQIDSWNENPCVTDAVYEITLGIPECTYSSITDAEVTAAGGRYVYICGDVKNPDTGSALGWGYANAIKVPVTSGQTEITFKVLSQPGVGYQVVINGQDGEFWANQMQYMSGESVVTSNLTIGSESATILGWTNVEGCTVVVEEEEPAQ